MVSRVRLSPGPPVCLRCGLPVERNAELFETHGRMHWVCFHYVYEHGTQSRIDPDIACTHPQCPAPEATRDATHPLRRHPVQGPEEWAP